MRQIKYVTFTFLAMVVAGFFVFRSPATFPRDLPWFELEQAEGTLSKDQLKGSWTVFYFGYTHCPDLCPAAMNLAKAVKSDLATNGPHLPHVRWVFVSVDPYRDTPATAQSYATYFDPEFLGATLSITHMTNLLNALDTTANDDRIKNPKDYKVFHPTSLYVLNPEAQWVQEIENPIVIDKVKDQLAQTIIGAPGQTAM